MATTRKTAAKQTLATAISTVAAAGAKRMIDKPVTRKPAAKAIKTAAKPAVKVGQLAKDIANERNMVGVKTTARKVQAELDKDRAAGASYKPAARKVAAKVDARRLIPQIKIGKVVIERPARKKSDSFDSVPTISVKNGADTAKVFAKLPKGFTWLTDLGASTKDTLMIFNKHGVHIADLRTEIKHGASK
jgi:hypothetical protein